MVWLQKKTFYFGVWATLVLSICGFLSQEEKFFAIGGMPIAEVTIATQDATYRSEDDTRWKSISSGKQLIFDGDKLATGKNSSMIIDFKDGRVANVGEDSNVKINTIRQSSGSTYILSLPKGSVAIQKKSIASTQKKKTQFPIIIRSGGRDYVIEPGVEKGVVKTDKGVAEFKGRVRPKAAQLELVKEEKEKAAPIIAPPVIVAISKALPPTALVEEQPKKEEPVVEEKKPRKGDGLMAQIEPASVGVFFTFKPLSAISGDLSVIKWKAPNGVSKSWRGAIEISSDGWTKRLSLGQGGSFTLKSSNLGPIKSNTNIDGVPCAILKIRGGAHSEAATEMEFSKTVEKLQICSFADAGNSVPLSVRVSSLSPEVEDRKMLFSVADSSSNSLQIIISTPSQYNAILSLIGKAKSIKISKSQGMSASGTFIAKSGKVIAQLVGAGFNAKHADLVMGAIKGDFVFKGTKNSLFDATAMSGEELKEWVTKNTEQGNKLYVHSSGSLISIRRDFLEERQEVAQFVKEIASQIFTEKVEIIAFK